MRVYSETVALCVDVLQVSTVLLLCAIVIEWTVALCVDVSQVSMVLLLCELL
jgi:hypothetical protein